ncbi:52_t:CDS:2, partial [Cetraspora pellucida]
VKKYNNYFCLYCKPIRLPSHEFHNLNFLPDPIPSKDNTDHYATFQQVYGTKTTEEYRPTYIQSKSLTNEEQLDYQQILELYSYFCGAPIFPDDHYLKEVIFVCSQINCDSPIKILYYSSRKGNYPICYYCRSREDLLDQKEFYRKGAIKTNNKATKHSKEYD